MTPVGVFFICQNEDKCHFVNSTKLTRCEADKLEVVCIIHFSSAYLLFCASNHNLHREKGAAEPSIPPY